MRLFIAVNFDENVKDMLVLAQEKLKKHAVKGNWTKRDNLHLTVVFIGEVSEEKVAAAKTAIDAVILPCFTIRLSGTGSFGRGGGICWVGVEENSLLSELHALLCNSLYKSGVAIENRKFSPHVTIGREVLLAGGYDKSDLSRETGCACMTVKSVELMKSERIAGKPAYSCIYSRNLIINESNRI